MKRKLISILTAAVLTVNGVCAMTLNSFAATVKLAAPTLTLKSYATKATLSWNKNSNADGYQIYWCGGDTGTVPHNHYSDFTYCPEESVKLATLSINSKTSYTKTDLSYKKNYHFKVRAYKKSGATTVYSSWSNIEQTIDTVNRLNAASLKSRSSYNIINVQGSKNVVSSYTLTNKEKTILKNFAEKHFKSGWTAGEKIEYTAEWIRNNMTYGPIPTNSHTENIFVKKQGQCSDYNGALVEMMIYLGFDARLIQSYRASGGQHFWGEVIIDGSVFLMEVGEKASDSPAWGYKWEFLCTTYAEADGGYTKNGQIAKDSIALYPAVVTNFKAASKTTDTIDLTWTKVSGAKGYYIYKYNSSKKSWVRIARTETTSNKYRVSNLSAGTLYKFAVRAYKTANGQEISSVTYPTLTVVTVPATVSGFRVSAVSDRAVKLAWNKVKGAQGYVIYQYDNAKRNWKRVETIENISTTYIVTNLAPGKKYKFAVRAYRSEDNKEVLSPSYPQITAVTRPANVSDLKVAATSASAIKLTWDKASGANGYIVYRYNSVSKRYARIAQGKNTYFTDKNLKSGVTYKYAVRAYKSVDGKELLSPSYPQITAVTNPANVSAIKAAATSANAIKLTWDKASGANGYIVYRYNSASKKYVRIAQGKNTYFTDKKLNPGTKYKYAVRAYKMVNGKELLSKSYPQLVAATKPAKVDFTVTAGSGKATLKWNKVNGASGYIVYYKTSANGKWIKLKDIAKLTYTQTKLTKGKTYYFTVKAYMNYNGVTYNGSYVGKSVKIK